MLSKLTGDRRFYDIPKAATKAMFDRRSKIDLLADKIDVRTGQWLSRHRHRRAAFGQLLRIPLGRLAAVRRCRTTSIGTTSAPPPSSSTARTWSEGRLWFPRIDYETGKILNHHQSELDAFYGGLLGQGGDMKDGRAYTLSWAVVQDKFGVIPEGFDYRTFKETAPSNALRPELADAALNLWLLDRDELWRRLCRRHFLNMKAHNKTTYGYSGVTDVTKDPMTLDDSCPGYWWSEQMKYYYLIFSDTPRFDYKTNYLSTEGQRAAGVQTLVGAPPIGRLKRPCVCSAM